MAKLLRGHQLNVVIFVEIGNKVLRLLFLLFLRVDEDLDGEGNDVHAPHRP